jgi:hypothetical protein
VFIAIGVIGSDLLRIAERRAAGAVEPAPVPQPEVDAAV